MAIAFACAHRHLPSASFAAQHSSPSELLGVPDHGACCRLQSLAFGVVVGSLVAHRRATGAPRSSTTSRRHGGHGHSHGHSHGHGHGHGGDLQKDIEDAALRASAQRITWLGVVANVGLSAMKAGVGYHSGSTSIIADAAHSISDLVSDGVSLLTLKLTAQPPDAKYPYGYGRYETLGTFIVASLLVVAGVEICREGISSFFASLSGPAKQIHSVRVVVAVAAFSVFVKEILFRATVSVGKKARSSVVIANAWHHRSDALSSVVAVVSLGATMVGLPVMDAIGGVLVAAFIARMGLQIGWKAVQDLMDAQTNSRVIDGVYELADKLPASGDLKGIDDVRCRQLGSSCIVDAKVEVEAKLSISEADTSAATLRKAIMDRFPEVRDVVLQLKPAQVV